MRIGYVLLRFPVLSQTFIMNELIELTKQGHEVYIYSLSHAATEVVHPEVAKYKLLGRTYYPPEFARISQHFTDSGNGSRVGALLSQMYGGNTKRAKFLHHTISAIAGGHFIRLIDRGRLDVLHTHFYGAASAVTALLAQEVDLPFTFTCHATDIFTNPEPDIMARHFAAAARVITISHYNKRYLQNLAGGDGSNIAVVRACPILDKFRDLPRREKEGTILTVSRLVEKKGIVYGIRALARLVNDFPGLRYRIIGDGPLKRDLISEVKEHRQLDGRVKFLGQMASNDAFLNEMSEAALTLLPCVRIANGDQDGIPVTLQEAMCAGIPPVSTTVSGIPELIEDGQEGLLATPNNVDDLARAIRTLLSDPERRRAMGERARQKVLTTFNSQTEVGKLLDIWRQAQSAGEPGGQVAQATG